MHAKQDATTGSSAVIRDRSLFMGRGGAEILKGGHFSGKSPMGTHMFGKFPMGGHFFGRANF